MEPGTSYGATRDDTRDALCLLPDAGKLSLSRKLLATVDNVTSKCPVIRIPRKKTLVAMKSLKSSASLAVVMKSETPAA